MSCAERREVQVASRSERLGALVVFVCLNVSVECNAFVNLHRLSRELVTDSCPLEVAGYLSST